MQVSILGSEYCLNRMHAYLKANLNARANGIDNSLPNIPDNQFYFGDRHVVRDFPSIVVNIHRGRQVSSQHGAIGQRGYLIGVEIYTMSEKGDVEDALRQSFKFERAVDELVMLDRRLGDGIQQDRIYDTTYVDSEYATKEQEKRTFVAGVFVLYSVHIDENKGVS